MSFTVHRCPLGLEWWLMKKAFVLITEQWVGVMIKSSVYYWLMQLDTPVMSDPKASLTTLPRGHIKADTTQALTHHKSWARSTETCLFSLLEPWKAVFLYQPTHIYWNNKPQSSAWTRLPQLTVIFMFTPLNFNRSESSASLPWWITCTGQGKTGVRSSKSSPR